jgi:hypothetical protein
LPFRQQHYLAGLVLTELAVILDPDAEGWVDWFSPYRIIVWFWPNIPLMLPKNRNNTVSHCFNTSLFMKFHIYYSCISSTLRITFFFIFCHLCT